MRSNPPRVYSQKAEGTPSFLLWSCLFGKEDILVGSMSLHVEYMDILLLLSAFASHPYIKTCFLTLNRFYLGLLMDMLYVTVQFVGVKK